MEMGSTWLIGDGDGSRGVEMNGESRMGKHAFLLGPSLRTGTQCSSSILCQPLGPHITPRRTLTVGRAPRLVSSPSLGLLASPIVLRPTSASSVDGGLISTVVP